jgi:hypothetical protein
VDATPSIAVAGELGSRFRPTKPVLWAGVTAGNGPRGRGVLIEGRGVGVVGLGLGSGAGVRVGVLVAVGRAVLVGLVVFVGLAVIVGLAVFVGETLGAGITLATGGGDGVLVGVSVGVGVAVGATAASRQIVFDGSPSMLPVKTALTKKQWDVVLERLFADRDRPVTSDNFRADDAPIFLS